MAFMHVVDVRQADFTTKHRMKILRIWIHLLETFRFKDQDDYEHKIWL